MTISTCEVYIIGRNPTTACKIQCQSPSRDWLNCYDLTKTVSRQGHATTKIFNFIRNVVVMGQMLFLDSMEKNNFQLADGHDGYPICTFSSFCELVGYFFHRPAILFHSAASW